MAEQEQTAVLDAQQTGVPGNDQTLEAGVQTDAAVPAEDRAEFDYSQINEDWIRAALDRSDVLKRVIKEREDNGFNAGRQKRDKELRLEQGSAEAAQRYHAWVVEQIELGADPNEIKKQTPLWVKANRDTERVTTAKTYAEKVLDAFNVEERDNITQAFDLIMDDPDRVDELTSMVLNEALTRTSKSKIASLSLDDIPKDSALWTAVQSHIQNEVQKEYEAKLKEREPEPNAPSLPAGNVSSADVLTKFKAMTPDERVEWRMNASPEEVDALWAAAAPGRA